MRKNQPHKPRFRPLNVLFASVLLIVTCLVGMGIGRADTGMPSWVPDISGYKEVSNEIFIVGSNRSKFVLGDPPYSFILTQRDSVQGKVHTQQCLTDNPREYGFLYCFSHVGDIPGFPTGMPYPDFFYDGGLGKAVAREEFPVDRIRGEVNFVSSSIETPMKVIYKWRSDAPFYPDSIAPSGPIELKPETKAKVEDFTCFEGSNYTFSVCTIDRHGFLITYNKIRSY